MVELLGDGMQIIQTVNSPEILKSKEFKEIVSKIDQIKESYDVFAEAMILDFISK